MSWRGQPVEAMSAEQRKAATLAIQMIFQDPMSSLNPRLRVADIVGEAPVVHGLVTAAEVDDYVAAHPIREVVEEPEEEEEADSDEEMESWG